MRIAKPLVFFTLRAVDQDQNGRQYCDDDMHYSPSTIFAMIFRWISFDPP